MAAFVESMIGGFAAAGEGTGSVDSLLELLGCSKYVVDEITYASRTEADGFIKNSLKETPKIVFIIADNFNYDASEWWDLHSLCISNPLRQTGTRGTLEFINLTGDVQPTDIGASFTDAAGSGYLFPSVSDTYYFQAGVTYKMISAV